jgi:serine protease
MKEEPWKTALNWGVVALSWIPRTSEQVKIYRNNAMVATLPNTRNYTESTGGHGHHTYTYKVCEAATQNCSNEVTINF